MNASHTSTPKRAWLPVTVCGGRVLRLGRWSIRVHPKLVIATVLGFCLVAAIVIASLMIGTITLTPSELVEVFTGQARPSATRSVLGRRLPRALTAVLVGGCLAASGAVFQSLSRNPLGSPDIIGFTSGSATAAVLQIVYFGGGMAETAAAALVGGIGTALLVYWLARRGGVSGGNRLILVGIGVGSVLSALTQLIVVRADINDAQTAQLWSSGSLLGRDWPHVMALTAVLAAVIPVLAVLARRITLMEMGDDTAQSIGINVERNRMLAVLIAVTLAAAATAAAGPIAFIAFAAPQIVRRVIPLVGVQLGLSALVGAALLAGADLVSQNLEIEVRTPVGLVTSVLGGVYLLWLLARRI